MFREDTTYSSGALCSEVEQVKVGGREGRASILGSNPHREPRAISGGTVIRHCGYHMHLGGMRLHCLSPCYGSPKCGQLSAAPKAMEQSVAPRVRSGGGVGDL